MFDTYKVVKSCVAVNKRPYHLIFTMLFVSMLYLTGCQTGAKKRVPRSLCPISLGDILYSVQKYRADVEQHFLETYRFDLYKKHQKEAKIFKKDNYLLMVFDKPEEYPSLALTVDYSGRPIQVLLLQNSFGNNEFYRVRTFQYKEGRFILHDRYYETNWIEFPTIGERVLTEEQLYEVYLDKKGMFHLK